LKSMRERAQLAGGRFKIKSSLGHGTMIHATFPLKGLVRPPFASLATNAP
jgi:signal transduction histidine kinase